MRGGKGEEGGRECEGRRGEREKRKGEGRKVGWMRKEWRSEEEGRKERAEECIEDQEGEERESRGV